MRNAILILSITVFAGSRCQAQAVSSVMPEYIQSTYMIPMRDSVKLYTVVLSPKKTDQLLPILLQRTPYGAGDYEHADFNRIPYLKPMAQAGYIFVFQDMRGKFKSEGKFVMNRPLGHLREPTATDESTDAYDAVDWLVKHIPGNNGKVGILGISYLGYTALDAISDPHPALKASSPQASPADMFLGDDFHHNGAFRLSYGFEYSYMVENEKQSNSDFPFKTKDLYNWYLSLGSPGNVNEKYFHGRLPSWNDFVVHPDYDSFWRNQSMLSQIDSASIPTLHVGGYYDQEDLNGPQIMYRHLEKRDGAHRNFLVIGPWNHGGWADADGNSLGRISFGSATSTWFQAFQKRWFDYWLKGMGDGDFPEATCFQTGSNVWKIYASWPPATTRAKRLYVHPDRSCTLGEENSVQGSVNYVSDPTNPVPYRSRPIEPTYSKGSRWYSWQVEDQRLVSRRPDVVSFTGALLQTALTITGQVKAHLLIGSTGTDADFVVKLIDIRPDGFQFPVTMEVFRGRYRESFEKPIPLTPGKKEQITVDLHEVNHRFLPGHRLMVQIQSTWFPLIDRNPQQYVPNIFTARDSDYIKATETIYCDERDGTYLELPVTSE